MGAPWEKEYAAPAGGAPWEKYGSPETIHPPQVSNPGAPGGGATPPARGLTEKFLRSAGLVGKGLATGAASTAGMLGDAANTAINFALPADHQLGMPSKLLERGLNALGTPTPENGAERAVEGIANFTGGAMLDPVSRGMAKRFAPDAGKPMPLTQKQSTIIEGRKEGYKLPPSQGHGGLTGAVLEGLAGKERVAKDIEIANQRITNKIGRAEAGLGNNEPSAAALKTATDEAIKQGYDPLRNIPGRMTNGGVYRRQLDALVKKNGGLNDSFDNVNPDVLDLARKYQKRTFKPGDAVDAISGLRSNASDAFRTGNSALGRTQRGIADALEKSIELNLGNSPLLGNFRDARKLIAKQTAVGKATVEGSGNVNAINMGGQVQRHPEYFDGGLETMGRFANSFGKYAGIPQTENVVPTNHFTGYVGLGGGLGALGALAMGHPAVAALGAAGAAAPAARLGLRKALMSEPAQRMFVDPKLAPGLLEKMLTNPRLMRGYPAGIQGLFSDDGTDQR